MEQSKQSKANLLSAALWDMTDDLVAMSDGIISGKEHLLYEGSLDAPIMIVKFALEPYEARILEQRSRTPDLLRSNEQINALIKKVCDFRDDWYVITPMIPFGVKSEWMARQSLAGKLIWILEGMIDIVRPKIIITVNFNVISSIFEHIYKSEIDAETYDSNIRSDRAFYEDVNKHKVIYYTYDANIHSKSTGSALRYISATYIK
jgi:hypothetical protein